jgi:hypothetical protein
MITQKSYKKTRLSIIIASILKEPFACIYPLLPFILLKDLNALALQIIILTNLRPIASFGSFYISELVSRQSLTLKVAILLSGILARIAFIPALLLDSVPLYIIGSSLYMLFSRAEIPAWMEIIKKNIPRDKWEEAFSLGSIISYSSGVIFTILFIRYIDSFEMAWKGPFAISLILGIVAVALQSLLIDNDQTTIKPLKGFLNTVVAPIYDSILLLKEKEEFRKFQWAFMIGGLGLMIIQPVIPVYFTKDLSISYSELLIAFCICKALGFIITTPVWNKMLKKLPIAFFVFLVLLGFAFFGGFLIFAKFSHGAIFIAYLIYGVAQAGSHLIWHLSGPIFSGEESSSRYSGVNVVMVGIRGLIGPILGGFFLFFLKPIYIFLLSMGFCLFAALYYLKVASIKKIIA